MWRDCKCVSPPLHQYFDVQRAGQEHKSGDTAAPSFAEEKPQANAGAAGAAGGPRGQQDEEHTR